MAPPAAMKAMATRIWSAQVPIVARDGRLAVGDVAVDIVGLRWLAASYAAHMQCRSR